MNYRFVLSLSCLLIPLAVKAVPSPVVAPGSQILGLAFSGPVHEGWQFVPTTDIVVTSLGFGDEGLDGLAVSHDVGLFRSSDSQLLAAATVRTTDPLQGLYRYTTISPTMLHSGVPYQLVATFPTILDAEMLGTLSTTIFDRVTYEGFSGEAGAILARVGDATSPLVLDIGGYARFSSNLLFQLSPIPEPQSTVLLLLGLVGVFSARRSAASRAASR